MIAVVLVQPLYIGTLVELQVDDELRQVTRLQVCCWPQQGLLTTCGSPAGD
jgi:hypothetical protein